jgi:lysophospholipase L1-like esterase
LKRLRRVFGRILQVLLALGIVFLLLELGVRLAGIRVAARGPNNGLPLTGQLPGGERMGDVLLAGQSGSVLYPGYANVPDRTVEYRISSQAMRDREFSLEKSPGSVRIVCLGDSVTYGTGVDHEDTLPKQLEALLRAGHPGVPIEVLNAGIYATNTTQQVAWYRFGIQRFKPDLVLVITTLPDASGRNIQSRPANQEVPQARWVKRLGLTSGLWEPEDAKQLAPAFQRTLWLRRHSRLIDLIAHRLHGALLAPIHRLNYRLDWAEGSPGRQAVAESLSLLKQVTDFEQQQLIVAMYPTLDTLDARGYPYLAEIEILRGICTDIGIAFIDLLPPLLGQNARAMQAHVHDRHPNAYAHGLVARYLAEQLNQPLQALIAAAQAESH